MTTTTEAQAFLASQLREKVQRFSWYHQGNALYHYQWTLGKYPIKDTEWDYIARQVEAKLTEGQLADYEDKLFKLWSNIIPVTTDKKHNIWLIKLDYPTRATVLKEVLEATP
jgi:hypothetical protein